LVGFGSGEGKIAEKEGRGLISCGALPAAKRREKRAGESQEDEIGTEGISKIAEIGRVEK